MKIESVCLIGVLFISSSLAYPAPEPFIFDTMGGWAQNMGDNVAGVIKFGGGIASDAVDRTRNMTQHGINIVTDFGSGMTKGMTDATVTILKALEDASKKFAETIANSINRFTSRVITRVVDQMKQRMGDVERRAQNVLLTAEQKLDDIKQQVDENIQAMQDDLNNWSDQQIQNMDENTSEETRQQVETLLDNFVDSTTSEAKKCGDSLIEPVQSLHNDVKETVEESFPLIDDVIAQIQLCGNMDQKDFKLVSECAAEVKTKAEALKPLPEQYANLLRRLNRVAVGTIKRSPCVTQTIEKIQRQKMELQKQIKDIQQNGRDAMTSTAATEAQTESVAPEEPSTVSPPLSEPEQLSTESAPESEPEQLSEENQVVEESS